MFEIKNLIFIPLFVFSIGLFLFSCNRLLKILKIGQKEDRFDNVFARVKNVIVIAFGQSKLFREPFAGVLHFLIFWGFLLFIFSVIEAIIQGFYSPFNLSFLGPLFSAITIVQDVFGVLVILAIIFSLQRRFVNKVPRLQVEKGGMVDAAFILLLIMMIVISMFGQNVAHIAKNNFVLLPYEVRPLTASLTTLFSSLDANSAAVWFEIFWWIHILFVLGFMNYLPYSKHLHVLTSVPNVYFAKLDEEKNKLKPINLEDENLEFFGADDVTKFSWKQLLDGYSCTECGRCTSVCPAANSGKTLSPRKIIVDIRRRTEEIGNLKLKNVTEHELFNKTLVHDYISDKELWQCTTCNACVQECPVMIEHVDSIVDMRRHLVLSESNFPPELNNVFKSLETNYTPWAFNKADRAEWAGGLEIKTMAEDNNTDYLFWVGCAGSFDNRYKKVSRSFAQIMKKGGVNFRILGTEEKCNGDTARRLGNEYLAQQLVKENIETLNQYNVKKIVTACPHCYHSLKNEFKQFGGNYDVIHHTEMINNLLQDGKIKLESSEKNNKVTFHDSCYLGRYNNIYDAPRNSLSQIDGLELVEMERNKSKGFCCGAGGGRMFLEDVEGERINEVRTKEALNTNANTIASACPFCMTMMTDGVKAHNKSENVEVKDIAEIILENIKQ
ncbi:MAG: Fe-S oxidoreductase [Chlorobiaceae bacterium]|nr:Fe-S oxidoreductase [Chlorobiaceae bacterium]MBA4308789.1 Fe-S oxidoreductase [Chlorobiaceae bacterium]